jgi:hypothetical protein
MQHVLSAVAVLAFLYAISIAVGTFRLIRRVPLVERLTPVPLVRWPRLSVIVPACNEEDTLEQAMRSRLDERYLNAEYIVVDDRSTDRTGDIVDGLAREDARVVPVHVKELPDGWLGKVHAMQKGLERANGEWILFSDADIHHEPGVLARIVAHCEERGIDHVAVFPSVWSSTFFLDVMLNTFVRVLAVVSRAWKVGDPKSRVSIGGGNFNLVRRSALERAGGLAPIKLEVVDDAALGQALKWSGARQAILNARGLVSLFYYRSVSEAIRGMEKNSFAVGRFSVPGFLAVVGLFALTELGPFAVLVSGESWSRLVAGAAVAVGLGAQLAIGRWLRRPALPTVLAPLGMVLMLVGALRSMFLTVARGGIVWRGTSYSIEALRRGMRLVIS